MTKKDKEMSMYNRYNEICEELGVKDSEMKSVQRKNGLAKKRTTAIIMMSDEGYDIPELTTLFNRTPIVLSSLIKYNEKKNKEGSRDSSN